MNVSEIYCEKVIMPDISFRIRSFISSDFEHVIAVNPHWHSEIEILYIINGCAMQQVDEQFFRVETGDIIIISKNQLHSTYSYENSRCEILVVMFDTSDLMDCFVLNDNETSSQIFTNKMLFKNPMKSGNGQGKQIKKILLEINRELMNKTNGYKYIIKSLIYKISGIIIRYSLYKIDTRDIKNLQITRQMLKKTFDLIDEYYFEDISLKKAATASNLSIPHFCRLFKRATGMTFNAYLSFYRVNRAEKMLNSHKTISSIAYECGFGSVCSFIRNFKKYKKFTPSKFACLTGDGSSTGN